MSFESDLRKQLSGTFGTAWVVRDGKAIPEPEAIALGKDAVRLDGTVLYADLADSTSMVNSTKPEFAAEVYKAYLNSACRVIRHNGGSITAFDGDRVMAVFIGNLKNTSAVRSALNINWAVTVVNEELKRKWRADFDLRQRVGIDTGSLFVAKTGIRGSNDLVWVGRAANYAAKLSAKDDNNYASWITEAVYTKIHDSVKYVQKDGRNFNMWVSHKWIEQEMVIYKSRWYWPIS